MRGALGFGGALAGIALLAFGLRSVEHAFGVPGFLVWNEFDNLDFVRRYEGPVLVLHGEGDRSIPVAHARRLAEETRTSELEILPCGHNDCARPWRRIQFFLFAHDLLYVRGRPNGPR